MVKVTVFFFFFFKVTVLLDLRPCRSMDKKDTALLQGAPVEAGRRQGCMSSDETLSDPPSFPGHSPGLVAPSKCPRGSLCLQ